MTWGWPRPGRMAPSSSDRRPPATGLRALMLTCAWVHCAGMDPLYELQAETVKTIANARRLEIIHVLAAGPREVGRLAAEMGLSQPNVSQHLAVMRSAGIVEAERDGREVRYRLADYDVIAACGLMRGGLGGGLSRLSPRGRDQPRPRGSHPRERAMVKEPLMDEPINLVLFSGTDDKLQAAAI